MRIADWVLLLEELDFAAGVEGGGVGWVAGVEDEGFFVLDDGAVAGVVEDGGGAGRLAEGGGGEGGEGRGGEGGEAGEVAV